jgi:hypothetical protein
VGSVKNGERGLFNPVSAPDIKVRQTICHGDVLKPNKIIIALKILAMDTA